VDPAVLRFTQTTASAASANGELFQFPVRKQSSDES
jgi:hypothetical protein